MAVTSHDSARGLAPALSALRGATDPARLIEAGLIQLRIGELADDRVPLDAAQASFDEAIYRAPAGWPWPWYGLALTDLALYTRHAVVKASTHQPAGMSYRRAAIAALGQALQADSSFGPAADLLSSLVTPAADQDLDAEIQAALRRAARASSIPGAQLGLARLLRNLGHSDSALAALSQYMEDGGNLAIGLLESARTLEVGGRGAEAPETYLRGGEAITDSAGRSAYRTDIGWVASNDELTRFDALPVDSLGIWLRSFWAKRDAREMRAPGARLQEHLRRWNYVYAHYQVTGRKEGVSFGVYEPDEVVTEIRNSAFPDFIRLGTAGVFAATDHANRVIDDRGIIYMRYGAPDAEAQSGAYLGWLYNTTAGRLLFLFQPSNVLGIQAPTTLTHEIPLSADLLSGFMSLDVRYEFLAGQLRLQAQQNQGRQALAVPTESGQPMPTPSSSSWNIVSQMLANLVTRDRERELSKGLATDGFAPHFKHQLEPAAQFYAVGTPGRVLAVFALPGEKLAGVPLPDGGAGYPVTVRLIATNAQGQVVRVDTTRRFRAAKPLVEGQYLFGLEELPLPPGTWDVRLLITEPGADAGGAIGRLGVAIPSGGAFALSDLVLGRKESGIVWASPAGTVPLSPLDAYSRHGTVEIYYELSGAVAGQRYQTDLTIEGVSGDAKGTVHLAFTEPGTGSVLRTRRSLSLDELKGGQYKLTVMVTEDGTGRHAVQSRLLNVMK